ncbi:MAG: hypothetical protein M0C28_34280 [Candidatus Moduliflexus flocculans]|nr:hypothetical protein [Candidatus Moduliflexus flocculans]
MAMSEEGNQDVVEKIAGFIAELIPDGATMQIGDWRHSGCRIEIPASQKGPWRP